MSELKPCPFCGGEATMDYTYYEGPVASIPRCNKYGCIGVTYREFEDDQTAIEAWNHRPFESHAVEVLALQIGLREACAWGDIVSLEEFKEIWERGSSDKYRDKCRAQARELLGIKEGE